MRWLFMWMASTGFGFAADTPSALLRVQYASLTERLEHNPFQRALALDSSESSNNLKGSIHARIDYPFATFSEALNGANDWCEVLILHINTKYCRAASSPAGAVLAVSIGKKYSQPLEDAYPLELRYRLVAATPEYLEIQLDAAKGPLSTRDYRIRLQAIPVEGGRTFLHLTYSYGYGLVGRLAMKTYLATLGSGKVGFTPAGKLADGQTKYIGGVRGIAERNTMRYYLAIDAYLGGLATPPAARFEKRLQSWYAATERYARQLHEVDRADYVEMKRAEYLRQQTAR
jgi:hypothetical protein